MFKDLDLVSIKDLTISNIGNIQNEKSLPLFLFQNITKVILINVKISNITNIFFTTLFSF